MLGGTASASASASASPQTHNTSHEVVKPQKKKNKNNKNSNNSRRFSDEQIKSLESLFKMENKLEPRKKLEMARELGLHPRQVAIWFQNRRARWKSKQVEQDYNTLKAAYDSLSDRFDSLKKEKHALLKQLRNLCSQLKEPHEGSKDLDSGSENGDTNCELNGNSSGFSGPLEHEMAVYSSEDDHRKRVEQKEDEEKVNVGDQVSDEAHETVSNFDLGSLFDQSSGNWWDFWSSN